MKKDENSNKDFSKYNKNEIKNFYLKYAQYDAVEALEKKSNLSSTELHKKNSWFSDESL